MVIKLSTLLNELFVSRAYILLGENVLLRLFSVSNKFNPVDMFDKYICIWFLFITLSKFCIMFLPI